MKRRIDVHIDELVLQKGSAVDEATLRHALEERLLGLVAERGLPAEWTRGGSRTDVLSSPDTAAVPTSEALGRVVAETIHGGPTP